MSDTPTHEALRQCRDALRDANKRTRHPSYDWPDCLQSEVDAALAAADAALSVPAVPAGPEVEREVDAALGLECLPTIRISAGLHAQMALLAERIGMPLQAYARRVLEAIHGLPDHLAHVAVADTQHLRDLAARFHESADWLLLGKAYPTGRGVGAAQFMQAATALRQYAAIVATPQPPAPVPAVPSGWAFYTADFSMKAHETAPVGHAMLVRTGDDFRAWFTLSDEDRDRIPLYIQGAGPTIQDAIAEACKAAFSAHNITGATK